MITYGICINNNGLITYNEILIFIIDLLNHQTILINIIALVIENMLKSALYGKATLWFLTKSTLTAKE